MWVEDKSINQSSWDKIIENSNGDFKQMFNWGEYKKKFSWDVIRLIYLNENTINSAVQIFFKKKINLVSIFIPSGIINDDKEKNIKLIKKIYSIFKNCIVYIRYHSTTSFNDNYYKILSENNWKRPNFLKSPDHLLSIKNLINKELLLKSYSQKWRYNLKKVNKNEIKIKISTDMEIKKVLELAKKHDYLKGSNPNYEHDERHFIYLNNFFLNKIFYITATNNSDELISIRSFVIFNNCAWNYMNLTSIEGLKMKCNYLMLHQFAEFLIDKKISRINLGELNYKLFPGTFQFKTGFEKKQSKIIGELINCNSEIFSKIIDFIIKQRFNLNKNYFNYLIRTLKI